MVLQGIAIGMISQGLISLILYPYKKKAFQKSYTEIIRAFTLASAVRLITVVAIAIWGFMVDPLKGLIAIVTFGLLLILLTFFEVQVLWKRK